MSAIPPTLNFDDTLGAVLIGGLVAMAFVLLIVSYHEDDSLVFYTVFAAQHACKHMPISCTPSRIHGT